MRLADLVERARSVVGNSQRSLIGIAGPPGAGKSTLARTLAGQLSDLGAVVVPMDGFHLSNRLLAERGLLSVKGAISTFDVYGYLSMVCRLRACDPDEVVYAPDLSRDLDEPVAARIAIPPVSRLVITEGNYLLVDAPFWRDIFARLDETWYLESRDSIRLPRLIRRHQMFGRTASEATQWAHSTDARNADLIERTRARADLIVTFEASATDHDGS